MVYAGFLGFLASVTGVAGAAEPWQRVCEVESDAIAALVATPEGAALVCLNLERVGGPAGGFVVDDEPTAASVTLWTRRDHIWAVRTQLWSGTVDWRSRRRAWRALSPPPTHPFTGVVPVDSDGAVVYPGSPADGVATRSLPLAGGASLPGLTFAPVGDGCALVERRTHASAPIEIIASCGQEETVVAAGTETRLLAAGTGPGGAVMAVVSAPGAVAVLRAGADQSWERVSQSPRGPGQVAAAITERGVWVFDGGRVRQLLPAEAEFALPRKARELAALAVDHQEPVLFALRGRRLLEFRLGDFRPRTRVRLPRGAVPRTTAVAGDTTCVLATRIPGREEARPIESLVWCGSGD